MKIPDRLDVLDMTQQQAEDTLKFLLSYWPIEDTLIDIDPNTPIDQIANAILYLEDHIQELRQAEIARAANQARWGNEHHTSNMLG
jgi:hypothetical protein